MRHAPFLLLSLVLISGLMSSAFADPVKPALEARAPAADEDAVVRKLKAAVLESQALLGPLEPWQKTIFEEEAVPQYQRFIKDYRSAQAHSGSAVSQLNVALDMESLKNYLKFYAPVTLKREEKRLDALVFLKFEEDCEKCVAASPALRKLVKSRLERRGLRPVWVSIDDLGAPVEAAADAELKGKVLDERVVDLARVRNAAAALVLQWHKAPIDDIDTAHADEKRFVIHSLLLVRAKGAGKSEGSTLGIARNEGKLELFENDRFETQAARLLTDAFTDMGVEASRLESGKTIGEDDSGEDKPELALEIGGIRDFAQIAQINALLKAKLSASTFEQRRIWRGHVIYAISPAAIPSARGPAPASAAMAGNDVDVLKAQLVGGQLEGGSKLVLVGSGGLLPTAGADAVIRMEIQP